MIKQQRASWLAIISSLILSALLLAACNVDTPAEMAPTDSGAVETESDNAIDSASEETDIVSDITEIFEDPSDTSDTDNTTTTDAAPADTEVDVNGVPIGFTENGNPYRGNPNAPVVIEEFSDFQ